METDHTERATRGGRTLRSTEKRFTQGAGGVGGERLINMMFKIIHNNLQIIAKNKEGLVCQTEEGEPGPHRGLGSSVQGLHLSVGHPNVTGRLQEAKGVMNERTTFTVLKKDGRHMSSDLTELLE